jgi:outer membrane protein assembly factor BamB
VLIHDQPAARVGDRAKCNAPADTIVMGEPSVLVGGKPAARVGDPTSHGGVIVVRRTDDDAPSAVPSAPQLRGVAEVELSADPTHALTRRSPSGTRVWHVARAEVVFEHPALAIHGAAEPDAGYFALAAGPSRLLRFALPDAARATNGATGATTGCTRVAPDGSFWIDVLNGRLRCFDATGRLRWERQEGPGAAPLFARDGRSLVYCPCDAQGFPLRAQVHRADTGDVVAQARLLRGKEWVAAVSHDGSRLALRVENGLRVVAPASSVKAARVSAKAAVVVAAFAPDGASVAHGTHGGEVCVADCATGRIRTRWTAHCARVTALAFSRDGTRLISGSDDGSGAVWLVSGTPPLAPTP